MWDLAADSAHTLPDQQDEQPQNASNPDTAGAGEDQVVAAVVHILVAYIAAVAGVVDDIEVVRIAESCSFRKASKMVLLLVVEM